MFLVESFKVKILFFVFTGFFTELISHQALAQSCKFLLTSSTSSATSIKPEYTTSSATLEEQKKDFALKFNVRESEVTESKEDVLSGKAKVFIGSLKLETYDDLSKLKLKAITGDLRFRRKNAKGLENLTYVGGNAILHDLKNAKGLENLTYVGGNAVFSDLKNAKELENLTHIGGTAWFFSLRNARGLENLTHIGGDAWFFSLKNPIELENLTHIGGDAWFFELGSRMELKNLIYIGGDARFFELGSTMELDRLIHITYGEVKFNFLAGVHFGPLISEKRKKNILKRIRIRAFFIYHWKEFFNPIP